LSFEFFVGHFGASRFQAADQNLVDDSSIDKRVGWQEHASMEWLGLRKLEYVISA